MKLFLTLLTLFVVIVVVAGSFLAGWYLHGAWGPETRPSQPAAKTAEVWTCPMHPQIREPEPGKCPICTMDLVLQEDDDAGPRTLMMSEESKKLAEIVTAEVERRVVTNEVRMVGKLDYDETRVKTISAWVPGRLDRLFVDYTGISVAKGDHLVLLYSPEMLTAQEELIEAKKQVDAGGDQPSAYLRKSDIRKLDSAREKLRLWGLSADEISKIEKRGKADDHVLINSPSAGVVIHKGLNQGDYVKTGTPIYRIADLSHLWARLDAYESDLSWLRYGQKVSVETEAYPGEHFQGWISFIDPFLDDTTRTVKVRVIVDNDDGRLKPGMFVRTVVRSRLAEGGRVMDPRMVGKWICPMHLEVVEDKSGTCRVCEMPLVRAEDLGYSSPAVRPKQSLVVPASAVLATGKRGVVYVEVPGQKQPTYEGREVVLGPRAGDYYVILAGLAEGERVVVHGNFKIDSALQIKAKKSMMSLPGDPTSLQGKDMMLFRTELDSVYSPYFAAQKALAQDDAAEAREALGRLVKAVSSLHSSEMPRDAHERWHEIAPEIHKAATDAKDAGQLGGVRSAFAELSRAVLELDRVFGHSGQGVHYEVFCSMALDNKGARWLQTTDKIKNPYFGSSMLSCGEVKRLHPGRGGKPGPQPRKEDPETPTKQSEQPTTRPATRKDQDNAGKQPQAPKDGAFLQALQPVYEAYFAGQEALAGDKLDAAKAAFARLDEALSKVTENLAPPADRQHWASLKARLTKAVKVGNASTSMAGVRGAFRDASDAIIALEKRFGHHGSTTYYEVFCSMAFEKGAAWLQTSDKIRNPFYGASMLTCGAVRQRYVGKGAR
jgi:Cu(I)/Ag(I) efflux system membrane fusion protein